MKVFVDTNVIIDFYDRRPDFYLPAAKIFDLAKQGNIQIAVSTTSFVNAFYLLRKSQNVEDVIVTRNKKDFENLGVNVMTPIEFLNDFFAKKQDKK